MNITLGDKIKINDEEVPEYLLKALYENLKQKFNLEGVTTITGCIDGNPYMFAGGKIKDDTVM